MFWLWFTCSVCILHYTALRFMPRLIPCMTTTTTTSSIDGDQKPVLLQFIFHKGVFSLHRASGHTQTGRSRRTSGPSVME